MKCSLSIHKRTNETNFHEFINSRCIDASYGKAHEAHHTHALWQKGKGIRCTNCGTQSHLDAEDRVILTKALKRPCQGQSQKSPTLAQLFSTQSQHSQTGTQAAKVNQTGHETQPPPEQAATTLDVPGLMSPPVPKKLRFSSAAASPHMADSPQEQGEEETSQDDPCMDVDYFYNGQRGHRHLLRSGLPTLATRA